jgi:hypothetical protein
VHVLHISQINFDDVRGQSALCLLYSDCGIVSLQCKSDLPMEACEKQHRAAWLKDALRQQRKMPEFRNGQLEINVCPRALSSIGVTEP